MRRSRKSANPFYVLLIIAGLSFVMTATAYVVMTVRESRAREEVMANVGAPGPEADEHPLMLWMRLHGNAAILTELGLLAVFTVGAIATDSYWQRRVELRR